MTRATPLQTVHDVDEAFNTGNLEAVLECYDDAAVMVIEPGKLARGKAEIRKALEPILQYKFRAKQIKMETIETGDTALFISQWRLEGKTGEGGKFTRENIATCVFRKQPDGRWKILIDNSFGPAILDIKK
jgi:uncharacterized protein (TIGR02246 family)